MNIEPINEKISNISIIHDDEQKTGFSFFYGTNKYPVNFPLLISVAFVNVKTHKLYQLEVNISNDKEIVAEFSAQQFIFHDKDMVFLKDGIGQAFIKSGLNFNVKHPGTYRISFVLKGVSDDEILDEHTVYSYFGE
ncbi:hypothetical protein [Streptococcus agalactiae]|uniref:hypothetical protein n=1 Tax=Streptococcus agalactiae TaxID=1311 RepID=UPI0024B9B026|nr:hypothetical protein [Streptococcus agalactiae]